MFTYLHGVVVPTSVYAASADWGSGADTVKALPDRIERAAGEFAALVAASDRSSLIKDPFALEGDFRAMIGGFSIECDPVEGAERIVRTASIAFDRFSTSRAE